MKNEYEFKENVEDLAEAMRSTGKCLIDVEDHAKIASVKDTFVSLTKMLRDAALFVEIYQTESRLSKYNSILYISNTAYRPTSF